MKEATLRKAMPCDLLSKKPRLKVRVSAYMNPDICIYVCAYMPVWR